jgi:hypothetical protein
LVLPAINWARPRKVWVGVLLKLLETRLTSPGVALNVAASATKACVKWRATQRAPSLQPPWAPTNPRGPATLRGRAAKGLDREVVQAGVAAFDQGKDAAMTQDKDIAELERDVEQARARLVADIAKLRAPVSLESARRSVVDTIYGYRDGAMDAAQSGATNFVDVVKAKAAANPVAVAAILAGVAWRLYRHPPIASLLIGAGVAALVRTDPNDDSLTPGRLAQRAAERARELKDRAAAQISQLTEGAAGGAQEKLHEWSAAAERALESVAHRRKRAAEGEVVDSGAQSGPLAQRYDYAAEAYSPERSLLDERLYHQKRDAYLLGFAALALGAAIGAARRRSVPASAAQDYV